MDAVAEYAGWAVLAIGFTSPVWGPPAILFGFFHLLARDRSERFWGAVSDRWETFCTRQWRKLFPLSEGAFAYWVRRAGEGRSPTGITWRIACEGADGFTALLNAERTYDGVAETARVLVEYRDHAFFFTGRVGCPPPGRFPASGEFDGCRWRIEPHDGGHALAVTRQGRDLPRMIPEWVRLTVEDTLRVRGWVESANKAPAS